MRADLEDVTGEKRPGDPKAELQLCWWHA